MLPPDMSLFGFGPTEHEPSDLRGGESAVSEPGTSCFSQLICEYLCGEACSLQEPAGTSPKFQIKKKNSAEMDGYWNQLELNLHTDFVFM